MGMGLKKHHAVYTSIMPLADLIITVALLVLHTPSAHAQSIVDVSPTRTLTTEQQSKRADLTDMGAVVLSGAGESLTLTYSSAAELLCGTGPLRTDGLGDPQDLIHFTLPSGENTARIDLSISSGWAPWTQQYYFSCLGPAGTRVEFGKVTFTPAKISTLLTAAVRHVGIREEFQVATTHTLRGYRITGIPLGALILLPCLLAVFVLRKWKKQQALLPCLAVLLIGMLLYQVWFSIDLLRFTSSHLARWNHDGTYESLGAVQSIAQEIRKESKQTGKAPSVFVCTSEPDFFTKALRYFLYPAAVSIAPEDVPVSNFIVVKNQPQWHEEKGILTCGRIEGPARRLQDFPDGTVLFATFP